MPHNKEGCCKSAAEEPEHVEGQASLIIDVETNNQISNGFLFHENIRVNLLKCCYVSCYSFSLQLTQVFQSSSFSYNTKCLDY